MILQTVLDNVSKDSHKPLSAMDSLRRQISDVIAYMTGCYIPSGKRFQMCDSGGTAVIAEENLSGSVSLISLII